MAIIGVCYESALHNIVYTALYNCVYNILHTKITIYNVSDNEIHDVINCQYRLLSTHCILESMYY